MWRVCAVVEWRLLNQLWLDECANAAHNRVGRCLWWSEVFWNSIENLELKKFMGRLQKECFQIYYKSIRKHTGGKLYGKIYTLLFNLTKQLPYIHPLANLILLPNHEDVNLARSITAASEYVCKYGWVGFDVWLLVRVNTKRGDLVDEWIGLVGIYSGGVCNRGRIS